MPTNVESQLKADRCCCWDVSSRTRRPEPDRILANDLKNVQAQILGGSALAGLKDLDSAITPIEGAIQLDPERSGTITTTWVPFSSRRETVKEPRKLTKAVQIDGQSVPARLGARHVLFGDAAGRRGRRRARANPAARPGQSDGESSARAVLPRLGRRTEAEPQLKKLVAGAKTPAAARLALADYYTLMHRSNDAVQESSTRSGARIGRGSRAAQTRLAALEYAGGQKGQLTRG